MNNNDVDIYTCITYIEYFTIRYNYRKLLEGSLLPTWISWLEGHINWTVLTNSFLNVSPFTSFEWSYCIGPVETAEKKSATGVIAVFVGSYNSIYSR